MKRFIVSYWAYKHHDQKGKKAETVNGLLVWRILTHLILGTSLKKKKKKSHSLEKNTNSLAPALDSDSARLENALF